jgi:autotransporter-associated beta strand protein
MLFEPLEDRNLLATLYWDPNGVAAGVGGAGTWDATSAFWTTDPTGAAGHVTWDSAANDTAVFAGTVGTVTINPTVAAINAGGLDFDVSGYTLATAASKSLTFATGANVDVDTGVTATISGVISGANGFTKINAGELILSAANTYTGVTTINGGAIVATANNALGTTAGNTVIGTGATLDVRATVAEPLNIRGTGVGGNGALISSTTGAVSGTVTQAAASSIGGNGNLTISGVVSGNFTLTKVGTGTLTLSGTNTYTSATVISAGTLVANNAAALGTNAGGVTIASGATLDVRNNISTEAISVSGAGVGGNGALISGSGTGTVGGTVTMTGATTIGGPGTLNINGNLVGAFPLTKVGTGTTALSGTNTFSALAVSAGTVRLAREASLPAASRTDTNLVVNSGATLAFNVGGTNEFTAASIQTLSGLGTMTGGFQNGSFLGFDASNAPLGTFTYSNPITNTNGGANVIGVASLGTGIVRLSGANTYTGPTQVRSGSLVFVNPAALYGGVPANWTPTTLVVSSGATLGFGVGPGEFTASDIDTLNDLGTATGGFLNGSNFGIDTTNATAPFEYAGAITNTNAGANAIGVMKLGPGTLVLSGANSYTGPTTILGGTLQSGSATAIPAVTALVLGNRSGNVGNLDLTNFSQTVASITAASNSATANTITVGDGQTLTVNGTGGITVGIDLGGSSSTQTRLNITGPGALVVNNTAANVTVGLAQANQATNNTGTLDLSGLGSVTLGSVAAPINEVRVGYGQTNDGTLLLSNTSNVVTANNIYVGNSLSVNAHGSPALVLGTGTNVLNATLIGIGLGKSADSSISFASQLPGSPGTVTIAGKTGGSSTATISVGSNTAVDTGAATSGTLDLRGHAATVAAGTVTVGQTTLTGTSTGSQATGILSFDQGTFTATTVNVGVKGGASPGPGVGTLNIGGGSFTATTVNLGTYSAIAGVAATATTGTLNLTGGTLTVGTLRGAAKTAAGLGSATSNINVSGGNLVVNTLFRLASQATAGTAIGNLNVTGTGVVTSNVDITDGGGAATTSITLDGGTLDLTNHAIGPGTPVDTLTFASGTLQNVTQINDGAGLTKSTDGQLILAGTNAFTGPTTVNDGTLVVNGTLAAGSPVTVNDGGTLGGTGTISGTVTTVGTGEIDAGGAAPGGGTLQLENTVTLAPTSTFGVQIGGTTPGDGNGTYDQITTTGGIDLGGATLDVTLNGFTPATNNQFTIINKTSAGPVTGTFSYQGDPLIQGEQFVVSGTTFQISYTGGDGNDVVLTALTGPSNLAPTDIALTPTTIAENSGPNATVGTFTTTDPDTGDTFTYTLVTGAGSNDNAAFNISGNTLRATNSLDFESQPTYSIRVRSTDAGGLFFEEAFTINVTDVNEAVAGITVTPATGLTTTEAGGTATFTIVLNTQPTADVTIPLSSSDTTEGTVSPASVTFTTANWNVPQTVTITGVNDAIVDGAIAYNVVTGTATSTDPAYTGINAADVAVSNTDNDAVGVTVAPTTGLTTTEAGGTATFTIVLNSQPTADVTIPLSSSDTTEGTVAPSSVTFTTANWNTPQTVTVTGVNDAIVDGTVAYNIVTGTATSTDTGYTGFNAADVAVSNTDNDTVGVTVAPTSGLTTTEAGSTATFTVVLTSQPTADVTIPLSSSDITEGTVSPASVTFTTANWNVPQTVTVTGIDDAIVDGTIAYTINTGAATSTDPAYSGFNAADVAASNTDNDSTGTGTITVTPSSGLTTTEAGGVAAFMIVLNSQPTANVTIPLTSSDTTEGTVSPASVTFTPTNWSSPQIVIVTGVDDAIDDGDVNYTIVTGAATSTDTNFSGVNPTDVSLTNTDNDNAAPTPGLTVTPTEGLATTEAGGSATFTIALRTQPTSNVTIPLSSSDPTEGTASTSSVTFTPANWNVPQTVTVTGVDDAVDDGDIAYSIITGLASSTDPAYQGVNSTDVSVTNVDNDTAANTPPTISDIGNQTTNEDVPLNGITFTVGDAETPASSLTVTATSSNTTLFPNGSITFGGSGADRTISLNPAANASGTATITVTVNDGTGGLSSDTFTVTVSAVNDPPVANDTSLNTPVNTPVSGTLSATDPDSPSLTYSIVMNPALGTLTSFNGATGAFTYTPNPGATGLDLFTFNVMDGTSTDTGTVRISIQESGPTVIVNGGELIVTGTGNADSIVVTPVSPGVVQVRTDAGTANYPVSTQLTINSGEGNDYVTVEGVTVPTTINLGGGDDYASSGAQDDTIIGGLGRDQINAGAGNNTLWGDNLNEQDLPAGGDDVLSSQGGNDVLYGGGGADQLYPGAGNDYVNAGQGDDLVSGGAGDDRLYGGGGNDGLYGDEGNDVFSGGAGSDSIVGRTGSDVLIGGVGADLLNGDEGNDLLFGNDTTNSASSTADDANDMALMSLLANWVATRPAGLASSVSAGSDGAADSLQGYTGDDDFYLAPGDSAGDFGLPFMGTDRTFNN